MLPPMIVVGIEERERERETENLIFPREMKVV